jgi:hypothetical protein
MRDLYHNVLATQVLAPATATTTQTSSTIDMQGYNALSVVFDIGHSGDTLSGSLYWTLSLQDSPDGSTWTAVASPNTNASYDGGSATIVVNTTSSDRQAYSIGYIGNNRYIQGIATPTGAVSSGMPIGIVALRGTSGYRPVVYP